MPAPRPFALIRTADQWLRVSHSNTALQGEVVQLYWQDPDTVSSKSNKDFPGAKAGLAFDGHCRLYHSIPDEGQVERVRWAAQDPLRPNSEQPVPVDLFAVDKPEQLGDFALVNNAATALATPRGLAVDDDERLFVAEAGAKRILVYDLWSNRLVNQIAVAGEPLDLVAHGRTVYVLLGSPPGLLKLSAHIGPQALALPPEITDPSRIALSPGRELFILESAGQSQARVVKFSEPTKVIEVKFATDIEFHKGDPLLAHVCSGEDSVLVVARRPGEDFLRFCVGQKNPANLPPLKARGYDGQGIVATPDGRIGFWTESVGFRHAVAARLTYFTTGDVTTFRLDSGEFHNTWGRLFLDACIPKDTSIVVRCITADEPPDEALLPLSPPGNTLPNPPHPELSPPMPPQTLADQLKLAPAQILHRRESGRELPWVRPAVDDVFETYEAPVLAGPGRYLWVRLELSGNTRTTPRFKSLRAEYPTHDYLRRLPRTFSRDEVVASFLRRYLATFEGLLGELEGKADARRVLLNPRSAPSEMLPWLASFLGLTLDERMARAPRPGGLVEDVRRTLIEECTWLFRFRGTVLGLRRFIEIYLGVETILIEKFRVRGLGGALLGDSAGLTSSSVIGAGYRVGGAIGEETEQTLNGSIDDAFATHAHRFALIVPASLTSEQQDVVARILELHRPAHTLVEVCTVVAGMCVGRGLHVAFTSLIGRRGGSTQLQLGAGLLGRGTILGRPGMGRPIGGSPPG